MKQNTLVSAALGLLFSCLAVAQRPPIEVVGKGTIAVLNGTSFDKNLTIDDKVGCLNANGALTLDDCAIFTVVEPEEFDGLLRLLSTKAGICTFQNKDQPKNVDSEFGKSNPSFSCYPDHPKTENGEAFYTINGFPRPFICNGRVNCIYDIKGAPEAKDDAHPVWTYVWGREGVVIAPGHLQVAWLWVPEGYGST